MSNPSPASYPSPLAGYEDLPPLPNTQALDRSFVNPPAAALSPTYTQFPDPIANGSRGGFDVHIYYHPTPAETTFAQALWERIRREFPELRIYRVHEGLVGPHPLPSFEVDVLAPAQFGAFVPWLVANRGPLSVLVHPNTPDPRGDHTLRALWLGERLELDMGVFR